MAYEENTKFQMEILEDGQIQIRKITVILRDGIEIAHNYHRHVLEPGQDTAKEADRVKAVAATVWTKEVVDEFKAKKEALLREVPK